MFSVVYNPSPVPVVVDPDGRTVPGHSWGTAATEHPFTTSAIASGRIVPVAARDGDDLAPAYTAARETAEQLNRRVEQLRGLSAKKLRALTGDDEATVDDDELVRRLAHSDIDIPAGRSRSRTERGTTEEEDS